jgi:hypothetical protein
MLTAFTAISFAKPGLFMGPANSCIKTLISATTARVGQRLSPGHEFYYVAFSAGLATFYYQKINTGQRQTVS